MRTRMMNFGWIVPAVVVLVALAGCEVPHMVGLQSSLSRSGTTSSTSIQIDDLPTTLTLSGECVVDEGSLRIVVADPNGSTAFDRTISAGERAQIREELDPALGSWRIEVTSPGASGSYEVWLGYWSHALRYR